MKGFIGPLFFNSIPAIWDLPQSFVCICGCALGARCTSFQFAKAVRQWRDWWLLQTNISNRDREWFKSCPFVLKRVTALCNQWNYHWKWIKILLGMKWGGACLFWAVSKWEPLFPEDGVYLLEESFLGTPYALKTSASPFWVIPPPPPNTPSFIIFVTFALFFWFLLFEMRTLYSCSLNVHILLHKCFWLSVGSSIEPAEEGYTGLHLQMRSRS